MAADLPDGFGAEIPMPPRPGSTRSLAPCREEFEANARVGPTTPKSFGAKRQTQLYLVDHVHSDGRSAVRAAEPGAAVDGSIIGHFPGGTETSDRSFPTGSRGRPQPVDSGPGMTRVGLRLLLHACHPRPVNGYLLPAAAAAANPRKRQELPEIFILWCQRRLCLLIN